jgi:LacI family transcriptional regulator
VLLAPLKSSPRSLAFPWDDFSWVTIGGTFIHPQLHLVGRDYGADIRTGLEWLRAQGCRRPCFVLDPTVNAFFRRALLESALAHYHAVENPPPAPYCELKPDDPAAFAVWFADNRPDGVMLPAALGADRHRFAALLKRLPTVLLSPPAKRGGKQELHFTARYEVIGQAAVNVLHRLLRNRETGLPAYKQSVLVDSRASRDVER